jgi:hypothetical protein
LLTRLDPTNSTVAYIVTAVNYGRKMFIELPSGHEAEKVFNGSNFLLKTIQVGESLFPHFYKYFFGKKEKIRPILKLPFCLIPTSLLTYLD